MAGEKISFREALYAADRFSVTWELVPGRGAWEKSQDYVVRMAALAAADEGINAVTVTDNPGGKPAILAYPLTVEAKGLGIEPIVHFTCKDKNRNAIESELFALARSGIENLLVMTGDYPTEGFASRPKPVFDLDSVHALRLIESMNRDGGASSHRGGITLQPTSFFAGAVVSPFKATAAEQLAQYAKLAKKIDAGAKFIISQLGYDARKLDELRRYMDRYHPGVPLVGNIFVLSLPVARLMNRGQVPGCVVSDKLLRVLEAEETGANKKEARLTRAAKLYAVLKGLGYSGVNIGGHGLEYADIRCIIDRGEELSGDWPALVGEFAYPQKNGFYFFAAGADGLNADRRGEREDKGGSSLRVALFSLVHRLFFTRGKGLFPLVAAVARFFDRTWLRRPFAYFEYITKTFTNECRFCGDCVIHELAFICPMSQCPKQQRNGACGGSRDGWCEVYPGEKKCIYVQMYEAAGQTGPHSAYVPPCDWELYRTSSWLNYFAGRDYSRGGRGVEKEKAGN